MPFPSEEMIALFSLLFIPLCSHLYVVDVFIVSLSEDIKKPGGADNSLSPVNHNSKEDQSQHLIKRKWNDIRGFFYQQDFRKPGPS